MKEIFLETDVEPDDLLAIYFLVKRGYFPQYIVVGEGNPQIKVCKQLDLPKVKAYFYGSFNFRSLWSKLDSLKSVLTQFKSVVVYESYHANRQINQMIPDNCPQTWKLLNSSDSQFLKKTLKC